MKIAPIIKEMSGYPDIQAILVHTGQHYDKKMSKTFFQDLGIPKPDINLEVGSGSHAWQTAEIMKRFGSVLEKEKPDLILVVGDVNSTIACALDAVKLGIKVAHVEAGLRSFDRTMPEEINRVLTDAISDYLFITERSAKENLLKEGIAEDKIYFVGNVMIDTLLKNKEKAEKLDILNKLNLKTKDYALLTLHRPANVDNKKELLKILSAIEEISKYIKIVFPIHPRTKKSISVLSSKLSNSETRKLDNVIYTDPLGYLDFLSLMDNSKFVLTDSGGIQEETTVLGVPCLTLRENTERPVTIIDGTNKLVGMNKVKIIKESLNIINGKSVKGCIPELWDGEAAKRIVKIINDKL